MVSDTHRMRVMHAEYGGITHVIYLDGDTVSIHAGRAIYRAKWTGSEVVDCMSTNYHPKLSEGALCAIDAAIQEAESYE